MNFPEGILDDLVRDEGEVLHHYTDSLGYATIGVGRLIDKRRGGGISHDEAMMLLRNDVERFAGELDRALPWWRTLSEGRQRVVLNMAFNMGIGSVDPPKGLLAFQRTLATVRAGDYEAAATAMLKSLWARQVGKRAERLAALMRSG